MGTSFGCGIFIESLRKTNFVLLSILLTQCGIGLLKRKKNSSTRYMTPQALVDKCNPIQKLCGDHTRRQHMHCAVHRPLVNSTLFPKGTVSRDFVVSSFFFKHLLLGQTGTSRNDFEFFRIFMELFVSVIDSPVMNTPGNRLEFLSKAIFSNMNHVSQIR
jgi:hypothetical protein